VHIQGHHVDDDHAGLVNDISILEDMRIFATGSDDGSVKIWDLDTNILIREVQFNEHIDCITFANDRGDILVSFGTQIVLVQLQDYLPIEYLIKLIAMQWIDDEIEDSKVFDLSSNFWRKNNNNKKMKEKYPQLWDELYIFINIA
jgi:WD40 repeat protein